MPLWSRSVPELQRVREDHADALLAFELANREYFARFVSDRGDGFYEDFLNHHRALLDEQDAGTCVFHVLVEDGGSVIGRFNLFDLEDGSARVGYRVAGGVAGRGVASSTLRELCRLAAAEYGLHALTAETTNDNVASQRVLEKAGFVTTGSATVAGRPGIAWERELRPGATGS
jgi:ribosomal-protein-alanine N-acetyltransferase